jgi:hypothetical protein
LFKAALVAAVACVLLPATAAALPVFARIYGQPCGTCHTVFPQLNPAGESFRAHGLHGLTPAVEPLPIASSVDVPGTLPLAVYLGAGEDVVAVDGPGGRDPIRSHGRHLCLDVVDTGPGIPPQHMGRLFELFFTTKSSGTGLGLPVAKKIVERHGGTITVASEVGKGTRFTIELALAGPEAVSVGEPEGGRSTG